MNYTLDIDGYIGDWYNSKSRVKEVLAKHKGKSVTARFNSLGGDLNHGLDIAAQFEEHGDVTVDLVAFNASSSTVATLGAKKVRMEADGFYLIHKVMVWVNNWGYMNEDDIQQVIDQLERDKKDNEKITLQLARKYSAKTGKKVVDILNLMKEETWLTSEEAKEWGFVDEIYGKSSGKVNFANMVGKFNALGLPTPKRFENEEESESTGFIKECKKQLLDLKELINKLTSPEKSNNNNPVISMKKDWTHINAILNVEGVELAEGKTNMTEAQLQLINKALEDANTAKTNAENKLTEKETAFSNLETEFTNYKAAKGDKTTPVNKDKDGEGGEDDSLFAHINEARELFNMLP